LDKGNEHLKLITYLSINIEIRLQNTSFSKQTCLIPNILAV